MCHLAGEVADGVLLNWLTPEHARTSAEWVRAGAAAAQRRPPRLAAYVRVAVGASSAARLEAEGARYDAIPAYAAHFARMGVPPVATAVAAATAADVPGHSPGGSPCWTTSWSGPSPPRTRSSETLAVLRAARPD